MNTKIYMPVANPDATQKTEVEMLRDEILELRREWDGQEHHPPGYVHSILERLENCERTQIKFYCPGCKKYVNLIGQLFPLGEGLALYCETCHDETVVLVTRPMEATK